MVCELVSICYIYFDNFSNMNIFCLVLGVAVLLLACLCFYTCTRVNNLSKLLGEVDNVVSEVDGELTKLETHTRGALTGSYFMLKELENKFNSHCHSYSFENGVLYIQDPIINEDSNEETVEESESDNVNSNL